MGVPLREQRPCTVTAAGAFAWNVRIHLRPALYLTGPALAVMPVMAIDEKRAGLRTAGTISSALFNAWLFLGGLGNLCVSVASAVPLAPTGWLAPAGHRAGLGHAGRLSHPHDGPARRVSVRLSA